LTLRCTYTPSPITGPTVVLAIRFRYIKAVVEAVANAVVNVVAEAALKKPGRLGKPVVIEPDKGKNESHDKDVYTAFKELIKVEDYKASYLEAL